MNDHIAGVDLAAYVDGVLAGRKRNWSPIFPIAPNAWKHWPRSLISRAAG
jgi:hypothetical protein